MIGDILCGREKSKCVCIEDSVIQSGRPALISTVCCLCERVEKVHFIGFDRDPSYIEEFIPEHLKNRLVLHDGSRDVLGWDNPDNLNVSTDLVQYLNSRHGNQASHNVAIVIDSLTPMLLQRSAPYTCQTVSRLVSAKVHAAEVEQVVYLLHGDLHEDHSLTLMAHMATTVIKVKPPSMPQFFMAAATLHKRSSGKVVKVTEHFNLDEKYKLQDITEVKSVDKTAVAMETSQVDPAANLTFNLSLTDKEKRDRSQIKLPYTYDKDRQDETLSKSVGEGKIFYQPDEADDFDEEDPDDDLDI